MLCVMANSVYVDGHYLNLPVMNEGGEIVGMVDVLKLTYATLEQVCIPGNLTLCDLLRLANTSGSRSTRCRPMMMKAPPGTSSGCPWTMSRTRWSQAASTKLTIGQC